MNSALPSLNPQRPDEDEATYITRLNNIFIENFIDHKIWWSPTGVEISCRRNPSFEGRHYSFHHITSSGGSDPGSRRLDHNRCAHMHLIPEMIHKFNAIYPSKGDGTIIHWWKAPRTGSPNRIAIALDDFSYAVFIDQRNGYAVLVTAIYYEYESRRRKFRQECENFWRG